MTRRTAACGLLALGLMLAGCQTVERDEAGTICRVRDGEGKLYIGQEYNQADSLDVAVTQCTMNALDPTSCQELGCQYQQ